MVPKKYLKLWRIPNRRHQNGETPSCYVICRHYNFVQYVYIYNTITSLCIECIYIHHVVIFNGTRRPQTYVNISTKIHQVYKSKIFSLSLSVEKYTAQVVSCSPNFTLNQPVYLRTWVVPKSTCSFCYMSSDCSQQYTLEF